MPATLADFTGRSVTGVGVELPDEWPPLVRALQALAAVFQAKVTVGVEPADHLQYVMFGDAGNVKKVRVGYDGTSFLVQRNTGSDASPVWANLFAVHATTGAATLQASLALAGALTGVSGFTLAGAMDGGGQALTNLASLAVTAVTASTVNGFTIGGTVSPADVGTAAAAGANTSFARTDHVHKGLRSLDVNASGAPVFGNVNVAEGAGIDVSVAGQDVTVSLARQGIRTFTRKTGGNQAGITAEANVTELTALAFPVAPDGVKRFEIEYCLRLQNLAGGTESMKSRLYVGANGNLSDGGAGLVDLEWLTLGASWVAALRGKVEVVPAVGAKFGLSLGPDAGGSQTVFGNTTPGLHSWVRVELVP